MLRCIQTAAVLGAITLLVVCAAPARAAKGVKKNGQQHLSGKVVAVNHGKKGHGTITITVHHHKQRKTVAARRQTGQTRTFTVSHTTYVQGAGSGRRGLAALRAGEHVTIAAHNQHADRITVQHHHRTRVARR